MTFFHDLQGIAEKLIRGVPLFHGLTPSAVLAILQMGKEDRLECDDVVFREGDASREMFVVLRGRVDIERHVEDYRFEVFGPFTPGSCFGELALVDGLPRSATATATEPTLLLSFSWEDIAWAGRRHASLMLLNLARIIADRCHRLQQRVTPYLKPECFEKGCLVPPHQDALSEADIHRVEAYGSSMNLDGGSQVLWEGNTGKSLYVVLDGELDVISQRDSVLWHLAGLKRGSVFGEVAYLLESVPRTASVVVKDKGGSVLRLERSVLDKQPELADLLHRSISRQLSRRLRLYNEVFGSVRMHGCGISKTCPKGLVVKAA